MKMKREDRLTRIVEGAQRAADAAVARADGAAARAEKTRDGVGEWLHAVAKAVQGVKASCENARTAIRKAEAAFVKERDSALADVDASFAALTEAKAGLEGCVGTTQQHVDEIETAVHACNAARGSINDAAQRLAKGEAVSATHDEHVHTATCACGVSVAPVTGSEVTVLDVAISEAMKQAEAVRKAEVEEVVATVEG